MEGKRLGGIGKGGDKAKGIRRLIVTSAYRYSCLRIEERGRDFPPLLSMGSSTFKNKA